MGLPGERLRTGVYRGRGGNVMAEVTDVLARLQERRASVDRRRLATIGRAMQAAYDWIHGTRSMMEVHIAIHEVVEHAETLAEIDRQIGLVT